MNRKAQSLSVNHRQKYCICLFPHLTQQTEAHISIMCCLLSTLFCVYYEHVVTIKT